MAFFDVDAIVNEYNSMNHETHGHLNNIQSIIVDCNTPLEGNSFYIHNSLTLYPGLYSKQLNLFWCGKQGDRICEIGFNAGHSVLLMLLGRDKTPVDFTIFDIGEHSYTRPCLEYIKSNFQHGRFEYIEGDSTVTVPKWIESHSELYDVVHVDGGHSEHCISNDIRNADKLVKMNGIVIVDDTNCEHINRYVDEFISTEGYAELNVLKTEGYPHRIIKKVHAK